MTGYDVWPIGDDSLSEDWEWVEPLDTGEPVSDDGEHADSLPGAAR